MSFSRSSASASSSAPLPANLVRDIERAGYYPALVHDVVKTALAGEAVQSHLVHQETTFDHDSIRRHITVLLLTAKRLIVVHADDDNMAGSPHTTATATSESVPISRVRGVMLTHVVSDPASYTPNSPGQELTVTIGWGSVTRVDLIPASCGDPNCEADHGYEGTLTADDISVRVSAMADGEQAVVQAIKFAHALQTATANTRDFM